MKIYGGIKVRSGLQENSCNMQIQYLYIEMDRDWCIISREKRLSEWVHLFRQERNDSSFAETSEFCLLSEKRERDKL